MYSYSKHLSPYKREFSMLPGIDSIGFLPAKRDRVRRTFDSCNFSFILQGRGEYILRGERYAVETPSILIQWPGEAMDYGPYERWTELYFIYPREAFSALTASGLMQLESPVRQLANPGAIMEKAEQLQEALTSQELNADWIDLLCYNMLLESWGKNGGGISPDAKLQTIRRRLEASLGTDIDGFALASELGMSLSSLRRYWRRNHGPETFQEYRNSLFLCKSCRLLVETSLQVKEIAEKLSLSDHYYFSRKFHQLSGMTPMEYRKKHQIFK